MLDAKGALHLLEGNGYPLVTHYPSDLGLTPLVWEEMTDLILGIQTSPETMDPKMTTKAKFRFGNWHLVFNELEEEAEIARGNKYNACKVFGANTSA
jgi:hypothetical protein